MSRPFMLDPLFRPLTTLPGVGPKGGTLIERLVGGPKILDLLHHLPIDFIDRRFSPQISESINGRVATIEIRIDKHIPSGRSSAPYRINTSDDSGQMNLVFFRANTTWIEKQLPVGEVRIVSGKIEHYQGQVQMVHPDAIVKPEEREEIERIEPIYPLTQGITNKALSKAMYSAKKHIPQLPEWLDESYKAQQKWDTWDKSLLAVHSLEDERLLSPQHPARARLAYDELLSNQLTLALVRQRQKKVKGRIYKGNGNKRSVILDTIPFELTEAQKRVLNDIDLDMGAPARMLRLIQGDVGSGKTIVACLAMMNAIENNTQAALMAPTEILARQHAQSLTPLLQNAGINVVTLTGRDKGKARTALLTQIKSGEADIVIGTHAIFQDSVEYHDLGLAVIDEQHRFGVHQRLSLSNKGDGVDMLVMTATPIPRTLALTAYGDMEISKIDKKPPGRKPIDTRLLPIEKIEEIIEGLKRQIKTGTRVYWVCPLVEESEKLDLAAAQERFDILQASFGDRIGLIHGRLKAAEKDEVMSKFSHGDLDIIVATTVIEVGVNVPEATVMVIEHAERFGLSQLHQLRGRVGRGSDKSYCFLLYSGPLGETAKERLSIMRKSEDGFLIAEKDLELRGHGDILGVKQSGNLEFKLADLSIHADLLAAARDDAKLTLSKDPNLSSPRGEALKTLLYLFERDQAIQNLRSG